MAYDWRKDFQTVTDGKGGTKVVPRPHLARAVKNVLTRDSAGPPDEMNGGLHLYLHLGDPAYLHPTVTSANPPRRYTYPISDSPPQSRARLVTPPGRDQSPDDPNEIGAPSHGMSDRPSRGRGFLPGTPRGRDQEEGEEGEGKEKVIGTLPDPGEGMMYRLDQGDQGEFRIVHCLQPNSMEGVNEGDNRRSWSESKTASVLRRMNRAHRAAHTRDFDTMTEKTIFTHFPGKGNRLELREVPGTAGQWAVMLISPAVEMIGEVPAAEEDRLMPPEGPEARPNTGKPMTGIVNQASTTGTPSATGDRAMTNRKLNAIHRQYWRRDRAA
jgi:hypothetical protein